MLPQSLLFASDATWAGVAGAGFLTLSLMAGLGERRRRRRTAIDAVGWVPWRDIAALTAFVGLVLLSVAASGWLHR